MSVFEREITFTINGGKKRTLRVRVTGEPASVVLTGVFRDANDIQVLSDSHPVRRCRAHNLQYIADCPVCSLADLVRDNAERQSYTILK